MIQSHRLRKEDMAFFEFIEKMDREADRDDQYQALMAIYDAKALVAGVLDGPQKRESGFEIPSGTYKPNTLGIYLDVELTSINVGYCGRSPWFNRYWSKIQTGHVAHTDWIPDHKDPKGYRVEVCFKNGRYIFSREGVLDDTFIHEYCHVLRGPTTINGGHDVRWGKLMERYGLEPTRFQTYEYI